MVLKRGCFHKAHTNRAGVGAGLFDNAAAKGFALFYTRYIEIAGVGNRKHML